MKSTKVLAAISASLCALSLPHPALAQEQQIAAAEDAQMNAAAKVLQASLDDLRARNFEKWISHYHPDAVVIFTDMYALTGRAELRRFFKPAFDQNVPVPEIVDSGWTGEAIYVVQNEYLPDGTFVGTSYAEYFVEDGKIVAVFGRLA